MVCRRFGRESTSACRWAKLLFLASFLLSAFSSFGLSVSVSPFNSLFLSVCSVCLLSAFLSFLFFPYFVPGLYVFFLLSLCCSSPLWSPFFGFYKARECMIMRDLHDRPCLRKSRGLKALSLLHSFWNLEIHRVGER